MSRAGRERRDDDTVAGSNDPAWVAKAIADRAVAEATAWPCKLPANPFTEPENALTYSARLQTTRRTSSFAESKRTLFGFPD